MILRWLWALHPGVFIGVVSIGIAAALWFTAHVYNSIWQRGYAAKEREVAADNRKANDAVKAGIKKVDDCYRSGGIWDSTRGVCS